MEVEKRRFKNGLIVSIALVLFMWLVFFIDWLFNLQLYHFGVVPHRISGLWGILFMPFIHGSLGHIISNTWPALLLGTVMFNTYPRVVFRSIIFIQLFSGIMIWLLAPTGIAHIGASGVIYGMAAFLFSSGFFRRDRNSMAISLLVGLLYGSLVYGFFPNDNGVSWQGHLFGAIGGVLAAYYFRKVDLPKSPDWNEEEEDDKEEKHFFQEIDTRLQKEEQDKINLIYDWKPPSPDKKNPKE